MKKQSRSFRLVIPALAATLLVFLAGCQDRPDSLLEKARKSVDHAAKARAALFSEVDFRRAETLLQAGWLEIARQDGRLAPLRDYGRAESLLVSAAIHAERAAERAQDRLNDLSRRVKSERQSLADELATWRTALDGTLTRFDAERYWSEADLALKTSRSLQEEEQYTEALAAIEKGRKALVSLGKLISRNAVDESQKMRIWRRWVDETVVASRQAGSIALVVDKSAHKLYVLKGGRVTGTFKCELGYNSAGQKLFAGDGATPEGKYRVTQKKMHGSKFYRALLLNYPNENDKKRFADNRTSGVISKHAHIGGLIEIHGDGGRNSDWTDGCVALTNDDMDTLMKYAAVGTPVTIVRKLERWP